MKLLYRRVLGVLAIGGGFLNFFLFFGQMSHFSSVSHWVVSIVFFCISIFSIYCGVKLLEDVSRHSLKLNEILWVLQIISIQSSFLTYKLFFGFHFVVSFAFPFNLKAAFNIGGAYFFGLFQGAESFEIGINVFALCAYVYIVKCLYKLENQ